MNLLLVFLIFCSVYRCPRRAMNNGIWFDVFNCVYNCISIRYIKLNIGDSGHS